MICLLFSPDNEHFVSSSSDHSVKAGWAMGASFLVVLWILAWIRIRRICTVCFWASRIRIRIR